MEIVKPFVKWAGGKNSLIPQLTKYYPFELKNGTIEKAYLGGEAASDVSGTLNSMQCNISGGSITNLYLGTDGSTAKSSTEEYVERKLDISKVTGTYVDGVIKNAEDGILEKLVKQ